jgi:hypothetical protein
MPFPNDRRVQRIILIAPQTLFIADHLQVDRLKNLRSRLVRAQSPETRQSQSRIFPDEFFGEVDWLDFVVEVDGMLEVEEADVVVVGGFEVSGGEMGLMGSGRVKTSHLSWRMILSGW